MPHRVTARMTVVLVSLAFSLAFGMQQAIGRPGAPKAAAETRTALAKERPGPAPDVSLPAARAVPALRDPLVPHKPKRTHKHKRKPKAAPKPVPHVVVTTPAPTIRSTPTPTATAVPMPRNYPTPAPRAVQPSPRHVPAPTPTPASGSFDTSGPTG